MFATGPRGVGFTIVWPEGVIFRSMMTYHVQFLLLVLVLPQSSVGGRRLTGVRGRV